MLRGINKQIIEIKCPDNECFEKILLFVKAGKTDFSRKYLQNSAKSYYESVMNSYGKVPLIKQRKIRLAIAACTLLGAISGLAAVLFIL